MNYGLRKKIDVQIEVSENISKNIPIDPVILIRILGILLDNAIEELETLTYGKLLVGIFTINSDLVFIIQNNVREDIESVQLLKKQGYSTKGETRGIGLANVEELISLEPRLLLETTIKDKLFIQKIIIMKG
ncbi:GHKL domain-containing protein [Carnobacterium maltaromaticum]|uniref:GHKL domain-containing protein n=1 Tax=Carnobacterium maltaromaticum TaxID=2751 RepID=UPI0039BEB96F